MFLDEDEANSESPKVENEAEGITSGELDLKTLLHSGKDIQGMTRLCVANTLFVQTDKLAIIRISPPMIPLNLLKTNRYVLLCRG